MCIVDVLRLSDHRTGSTQSLNSYGESSISSHVSVPNASVGIRNDNRKQSYTRSIRNSRDLFDDDIEEIDNEGEEDGDDSYFEQHNVRMRAPLVDGKFVVVVTDCESSTRAHFANRIVSRTARMTNKLISVIY